MKTISFAFSHTHAAGQCAHYLIVNHTNTSASWEDLLSLSNTLTVTLAELCISEVCPLFIFFIGFLFNAKWAALFVTFTVVVASAVHFQVLSPYQERGDYENTPNDVDEDEDVAVAGVAPTDCTFFMFSKKTKPNPKFALASSFIANLASSAHCRHCLRRYRRALNYITRLSFLSSGSPPSKQIIQDFPTLFW